MNRSKDLIGNIYKWISFWNDFFITLFLLFSPESIRFSFLVFWHQPFKVVFIQILNTFCSYYGCLGIVLQLATTFSVN